MLLLSNGWLRAHHQEHPEEARPRGLQAQDFPPFASFEAQKPRAIRRAKRIAAAGGAATLGGLLYVVLRVVGG